MTFGFREPYQILGSSAQWLEKCCEMSRTDCFSITVDAEMIKDANRCTMDLEARLQSTVHGKVKPCESSDNDTQDRC